MGENLCLTKNNVIFSMMS